jgi:hypothetical protein
MTLYKDRLYGKLLATAYFLPFLEVYEMSDFGSTAPSNIVDTEDAKVHGRFPKTAP